MTSLEAGAAPLVARPSERLFTVGIPVYNGRSLLRNCLQSVITSTFPRSRFEIIVVDDGSFEPETGQILAEFEERLAADPGFFRVMRSEVNSGGAARPRNRILDEATGEYVFFVDSDDTIGNLALERIADAVAAISADWIALNQVPVNGRVGICRVRRARIEVPRAKALSTLTVHKCFRRAEISRQQLRFDEELPSGQDVAFAFSYILNAERFLMLGDYGYYYLIQHAGNPNEPSHLSKRANTAEARIEKNERILRSMLTALHNSPLPVAERRAILARTILPRVLVRQGYLKAIVKAGPKAGTRALRRLSQLLDDPLVTALDPGDLVEGVTEQHLAAIVEANWWGLAQLVRQTVSSPAPKVGARWVERGRRLLDKISGRARHRQLINELSLLRRDLEGVSREQQRLAALLQVSRDEQDRPERS